MNAKLAMSSIFLAFVAMACQPGESNNITTNTQCLNCGSAGSGAGGNTSSSTTSNTGNTGSGAGGSAGKVCVPSIADPDCSADLAYTSCECPEIDVTKPSYCQTMLDFGVDICPNPPGVWCELANGTEPFKNHCTYDVPADVTPDPPDPTCFAYIVNSVWNDQNGDPGDSGAGYLPDGSVRAGSTLLGPSNGYFSGFIMSGKKLYYNQRTDLETSDSGYGEFSADCMSLTVTFTYAGVGPGTPETIHWNYFK